MDSMTPPPVFPMLQVTVKAEPQKHPGGRPTKYKPEYVEQAHRLCKFMGATDADMADFFDVAESTISLWKIEHPEFSAAIKKAKEVADIEVSEKLYTRAMGYDIESVHITAYEGQITETPIIKHFSPDVTAQIFWLKNRQPAKWRDVQDLNLHNKTAPEKFEDVEQAAAKYAEIMKSC